MRFRFRCSVIFSLFLMLVFSSDFAGAQDTSGAISGTVTDASGAVIPGASILVVNSDRNQTLRSTKTTGAGVYTATGLPIGTYSVKITAPGFSEQTLTNIQVHVNDTLTINGELKPGGGGETVQVNANDQSINLQDATQAGLINGTQVRELVLSSRVYEQLVALQPGVSYTGGDQIFIGLTNPSGQTNTVGFSVNGSRTSGNNWTVDGADNVDRGSNLTLLTYPSVDAIAEFKTLRNQYSAQFGRSASGQINVVTKSGSNDLHGSVYEFFKNDYLNANSVLNKLTTTPNGGSQAAIGRGRLRYNDFGYTVGGPVLIPHVYDGRTHKTYFFFSQEIRRVITYNPVTLTGVPSLLERQGTFTNPVCASVNTATGNCNPGGLTTQVTNFSNTARAYLKDIYSGVAAPDSTGTLRTIPLRNLYNSNQQIVRIDQGFGDKLNVFFRLINDKIPTEEPGALFTGGGYPGVQTTDTNTPGRGYLGHFAYVATPTLLIDGGYSYSQGAIISDPVGLALSARSPDVGNATKLPFVSTLPRVPALAFAGGPGITTYGPYREHSKDHNLFLNVTKTVGRHTLYVGVDYNHYGKTENAAGSNGGSFTFSAAGQPAPPPGVTAANYTQSYQQSFANFLTGTVSSFTQASYDVTPNLGVNQTEAYFQDNWKILPRLTLNLGVRYSKFAQPTDANSQLTTFDPSLYVAANAPTIDKSTAGNVCVVGAPCTGGVTPNAAYKPLNGISINAGSSAVTATSPYGNKIGKSDNLNFGPRLGFALDVFGNGKTSLRGGYGIAYDSSLFGTYEQNIFQNRPFINTPVISNTSFDNPAGVAANANYGAQLVRATAPKFSTPYNQQFSLALQQILPGGINVEVAYVGNHQVHLIGLIDINQAAPGAYLAAGLGTASANGSTNVINTTNVNTLNQIRPYRGYSAINSVQPIFSGNYNSLQIAAKKQFAHDSLIAANYTWSRALTNANADRTGAPQISSNPGGEYGRAAADRTHLFNMNAVYYLPFFYDQKGFLGHALGGWEASGILFANSGLPLNTTTSGLDPAGVGVVFGSSASSGRPDRIGNPNTADAQGPIALTNGIHNRQRWFNPNAFAAVPNGQVRVGNAQRNTINGPGWWRADVGVFRNFKIYDRLTLQLRGEAQNILNHTNPDGIFTATISGNGTTAPAYSQTAGNVSSYRDKRIMQIGAKIIF